MTRKLLLEYSVLKILWWMIIGVILVLYAATAGYDSGITMIMPFLRKETNHRGDPHKINIVAKYMPLRFFRTVASRS